MALIPPITDRLKLSTHRRRPKNVLMPMPCSHTCTCVSTEYDFHVHSPNVRKLSGLPCEPWWSYVFNYKLPRCQGQSCATPQSIRHITAGPAEVQTEAPERCGRGGSVLTPVHDRHGLFLSLRQETRYQLLILIPRLSHELTLTCPQTQRLMSQCVCGELIALSSISPSTPTAIMDSARPTLNTEYLNWRKIK